MEPSFDQYLKSLKSISGIAGSTGVLIPAVAVFTDLFPPLVPSLVVFVSALAAATLITVFQNRPAQSVRARRFGLHTYRPSHAFIAAAILILAYAGMIVFFTVPEAGERFQIGFYKMDWSLTDEGFSVKTAHPEQSPKQWMMNDGLFSDDGPERLWEQWSRYLTFAMMFVVFTTAVLLWTAGWALLAKEHATRSVNAPGPERAR